MQFRANRKTALFQLQHRNTEIIPVLLLDENTIKEDILLFLHRQGMGDQREISDYQTICSTFLKNNEMQQIVFLKLKKYLVITESHLC